MTSSIPRAPYDVEDLVARIGGLARSSGQTRDALTLWPERLHVARNGDDRVELFLEGSLSSFGVGVVGNGLEFGTYTERHGLRTFAALVVHSGVGGTWVRPMAHLAYEAVQALTREPEMTNEELLSVVAPFLVLATSRELLSRELQVGLAGELIVLQELLDIAETLGVPARTVLDRWTGWDSATRDYKGGRFAIEVKTTGSTARQHWIHPMHQLLASPDSDEMVLVCSLGLRSDRSRSYRLVSIVNELLRRLPSACHDPFWERLSAYGGVGFDHALERHYELEPGFLVTHPPLFFRVDNRNDILRNESFVGANPPGRVVDMSYLLTLEGMAPLQQAEREAVLREIVTGRS